jgi:SAM-dependent methyltransferase
VRASDLDDAAWGAAGADAEPERFAQRRAWLLARVASGDRVLDLGAGSGHFAAALCAAGGHVVALDPSPVAIAMARERVPGLDAAVLEPGAPFPLPDASVDAVWAGEVLEHVADTAAWLSEVRRVLRARGRLLLSTPYHGRIKTALLALARHEQHFDPRGAHLRFYTRRALDDLLSDFGFDEVRIETLGGPPLLRDTLLASARRARWLG